jgi:hypothetical protein
VIASNCGDVSQYAVILSQLTHRFDRNAEIIENNEEETDSEMELF